MCYETQPVTMSFPTLQQTRLRTMLFHPLQYMHPEGLSSETMLFLFRVLNAFHSTMVTGSSIWLLGVFTWKNKNLATSNGLLVFWPMEFRSLEATGLGVEMTHPSNLKLSRGPSSRCFPGWLWISKGALLKALLCLGSSNP